MINTARISYLTKFRRSLRGVFGRGLALSLLLLHLWVPIANAYQVLFEDPTGYENGYTTICTPTGTQTVWVGNSGQPSSTGETVKHCPNCLVSSFDDMMISNLDTVPDTFSWRLNYTKQSSSDDDFSTSRVINPQAPRAPPITLI